MFEVVACVVLIAVASLLCASLFGHFVHWMIHQRWMGPAYRGHMEHHCELYPPGELVSNTYRKAKWFNSGTFLFTPPLLVIIGLVSGCASMFELPAWIMAVFSVVLVTFGFTSDVVHDSFHVTGHVLERVAWFQHAREKHFAHHNNMKRNFGIVFFGWDKLFKTYEG